MRKLVLDDATQRVVNVIELDEGAEFAIPGHTIMDEVPGVWLGYTLDDGEFVAPPPPVPPEPTARELREAEIAAKLRTRTASLAEVQEFVLSRAGL